MSLDSSSASEENSKASSTEICGKNTAVTDPGWKLFDQAFVKSIVNTAE